MERREPRPAFMNAEDNIYTVSTGESTYTAPIFFLLLYIVFTFFPLLYSFFPVFGKLKIVLFSGIFLLASYLGSASKYTNIYAYKNPILFYWVSFTGIMCLGLPTSSDQGTTLTTLITSVKYLLVFLIMVKIVDSNKRADRVLAVIIACGLGMALGGIYTYFFLPESRLQGYRTTALDRGLFGDPNDLALLLNSILPFALYFFAAGKNRKTAAAAIGTIAVAIMLTFSRGGFLGLCVTFAGFFLFVAENRKRYLIPVLAAALAFWSLAPSSYRERIATIASVKTDAETEAGTVATRSRLEAWKTVLSSGADHWILGSGAGTSFYLSGRGMSDWHSIHNSFIQVFVETGIFGFLSYLFLFTQSFKQYRATRKNRLAANQNPDSVRFGMILTSMITYAISASFLPQAYSPILYLLTALIVIESELIRKAAAEPASPLVKPVFPTTAERSEP